MKLGILAGLGMMGVIFLNASCHKAVPVAAKPAAPAPVPVQESQPQAARVGTANGPGPAIPQPPPAPPQRAAQMTPAERATLNERLSRLEDALFDYDKSTIRSDATVALRDDVNVIRDILANYPNQKLVIQGHTDERGSDEYNLALGDRRAPAAEGFLSTMGIPQNKLTIISYGKDRPSCTERTEQCWQQNPRAHITAAP